MAIDSPSSFLNLGLDQLADLKDPQLNSEFQGIYNALHTLNAYMEGLRKEYEGSDSQNPAESLRFRRRVRGIALQPITAGSIVSPYPGGFVNGCNVQYASIQQPFFYLPQFGAAFISPRRPYGTGYPSPWFQMISANVALSTAAAGEEVTVGVDSGVIAIDGFTPGQLVWALDKNYYTCYHGVLNSNFSIRQISGSALYGDGNLYLGDNSRFVPVGIASVPTEGFWVQAPWRSGDWLFASIIHAHPVGICIAPGYVYIGDYANGDWPPN